MAKQGKTVIFLRHGKAADAGDFEDDFERPLVFRGRAEVQKACLGLYKEGIKPQLILASPATRTATTARIAAQVANIPLTGIRYEAQLYSGRVSDYLDAINSADAEVAMIVGHNPTIGELAHKFAEGIHAFPTSAIAAVRFESAILERESKGKTLYADLRK